MLLRISSCNASNGTTAILPEKIGGECGHGNGSLHGHIAADRHRARGSDPLRRRLSRSDGLHQFFLATIAKNNAVAEVKVLKLPLDVSSKSGLNGSTAAIPGKETAQFEIAVIFKSGV